MSFRLVAKSVTLNDLERRNSIAFMADIQLIQCKNQQKTSSYCQNIVPYKDIGIKESNHDVRTLTGCV